MHQFCEQFTSRSFEITSKANDRWNHELYSRNTSLYGIRVSQPFLSPAPEFKPTHNIQGEPERSVNLVGFGNVVSNEDAQRLPLVAMGDDQIVGTRLLDTLFGTDESEKIFGLGGDDVLLGQAGRDTLRGGTGNDVLQGGVGDDLLVGGSGVDTVVGGSGHDRFFLQKPDGRRITIDDFESGWDRLIVNSSGYNLNLSAGSLAPSRFHLGSEANTLSQRFLYDRTEGHLFFDPDGSGGASKVKIVTLAPNVSLTAADVSLANPRSLNREVNPDDQIFADRSFDIQLLYKDDGLSSTQKQAFNQVVDRWESIIVGDLPDVYESNKAIDDLLINVSVRNIDGSGNTLGQAGPTRLRSDSLLPNTGLMEFDQADLNDAESNGTLNDLITHELGHVLGFGLLWDQLGLIEGMGGDNPRYIGAQAVKAYNDVFNKNVDAIPLENSGGIGTRDFHWLESDLENELMTGYLSSGYNPLSKISIGAMADLGYQVNYKPAQLL